MSCPYALYLSLAVTVPMTEVPAFRAVARRHQGSGGIGTHLSLTPALAPVPTLLPTPGTEPGANAGPVSNPVPSPGRPVLPVSDY